MGRNLPGTFCCLRHLILDSAAGVIKSLGNKVSIMSIFSSIKTAEVFQRAPNAKPCFKPPARELSDAHHPGCAVFACACAVLHVGLVVHKPQVAEPVIEPVSVDVVNAEAVRYVALGNRPSDPVGLHQDPVNANPDVFVFRARLELLSNSGALSLIDGPTKAAGFGIVGKEFARTLRSDRVHGPIQGIPVGAGQDGDDSSFRSVELGQLDNSIGLLS